MIGKKHLVRVVVATSLREAWPSIESALAVAPDQVERIDGPPTGTRVVTHVWVDSTRRAATRAARALVASRLDGICHDVVTADLVEPVVARGEAATDAWIFGISLVLGALIIAVGPAWPHRPFPAVVVALSWLLCGISAGRVLGPRRGRWTGYVSGLGFCALLVFIMTWVVEVASGRQAVVRAFAFLIGLLEWAIALGRGGSRKLLEISLMAVPLLFSAAAAMGELMWRAFLSDFGIPSAAIQNDWFDRLHMASSALEYSLLGVFVIGGLVGVARYLGAPRIDRSLRLMFGLLAAILIVLIGLRAWTVSRPIRRFSRSWPIGRRSAGYSGTSWTGCV